MAQRCTKEAQSGTEVLGWSVGVGLVLVFLFYECKIVFVDAGVEAS